MATFPSEAMAYTIEEISPFLKEMGDGHLHLDIDVDDHLSPRKDAGGHLLMEYVVNSVEF